MLTSTRDSASQPTVWQQWFDHPELVPLRQLIFQVHLWLGVCVAAWVCVMSLTGSVLVFRDQLAPVLPVEWHAQLPRIVWDAHNALGFWCFGFVAIWGMSGLYLSRSQAFNFLYRLDPQDRLTDRVLFALATLHFGRFNVATQIVWSIVGLVPATLAVTGAFICCRRVMLHKPSNPKHVAAP